MKGAVQDSSLQVTDDEKTEKKKKKNDNTATDKKKKRKKSNQTTDEKKKANETDEKKKNPNIDGVASSVENVEEEKEQEEKKRKKLSPSETLKKINQYLDDPDTFVFDFSFEDLFRIHYNPKFGQNKLYLTHPEYIFQFRKEDNPDIKDIMKVTTKSHNRITWRCRENNHKFHCKVSHRTDSCTGCQQCKLLETSLLKVCPEAAAELVDSDGSDIYTKSGQTREFKCSCCGAIREQRVASFVNYGSGCKCCKDFNRSLLCVAPNIAAEILGDNNAKFLYANSNEKMQFCCSICHHIWYASPNSRVTMKSGCPACYKASSESKGEAAARVFLKENNVDDAEQEYVFEELSNKLRFDF